MRPHLKGVDVPLFQLQVQSFSDMSLYKSSNFNYCSLKCQVIVIYIKAVRMLAIFLNIYYCKDNPILLLTYVQAPQSLEGVLFNNIMPNQSERR